MSCVYLALYGKLRSKLTLFKLELPVLAQLFLLKGQLRCKMNLWS